MKLKGFLCLLSVLLVFSAIPVSAAEPGLARQVLAENDGWASYGEGTIGGRYAKSEHVITVTNRTELVEALEELDDTPKIIQIKGTININADENGNPVGPEYYADPEYDFEKYLEAYDPDVWGYEEEVSGPLEDARARSQENQEDHVVIKIPSNTTLFGLNKNAKIVGGAFVLDDVQNVIIRNIEFVAPLDFFPQWDPTDGDVGEWNSEYDCLTITDESRFVWIDHNTFSDGDTTDSTLGEYFDRKYQQHDGLLDVKNGSDFVTISYNIFEDHDKTTIIGSSDSRYSDAGNLRVTMHHNYFKNLGQRLPRIRYGQVHVFNNYYEYDINSEYEYQYAIAAGKEGKGFIQNNYFDFNWDVEPGTIIKNYRGETIYDQGNMVNGEYVDLVGAHNAINDIQLSEDVGWTPRLYRAIYPAEMVPELVKENAGVGNIK